jgi:sigma-B regulation protein RsbU (phosphoserine phosphatase)
MEKRKKLTPETQVKLLLEIAHKIKGTLDLNEILLNLLGAIRPIVAYDAAGVYALKQNGLSFLHSPRGHLIAGVAQVGFRQAASQVDPMLSQGRGIVGHVIRTGEVAVVPDVSRDPRYVQGRQETRSEMAVPILKEGRPIGALNLESDRIEAYNDEDVAVLAFFADAAAIGIEKAMLHSQILDKIRLEDQLSLAKEVQERLLPQGPPEIRGYDIAGVFIPTAVLGGDYYDYLDLPGGRVGLVIADVSGKGIPAALIMAAFRTLVRTRGHHEPDSAILAQTLNHMLLETVGEAAFVTAVYGVLEPESGAFDYVNCGHNPPLHIRGDGSIEFLHSTGPLLGVIDGARFQMGSLTLAPGEILALYTDGVVEGSRGEEEFGRERLGDVLLLTRHLPPAEIVREVVSATMAFAGRNGYRDDFTMVILKREPGPCGNCATPVGC